MKRTVSLAALEAIGRLQAVRARAAQDALVRAGEGLDRAAAALVTRGEDRDGALSVWLETLAAGRPDPGSMSLAGAWLVDKETALDAARLDRSIAGRARDDAAAAAAHRRAECDASGAVAAGLRKRVRRDREERQVLMAGDLFLQRSVR